jgi:hypothetical protein
VFAVNNSASICVIRSSLIAAAQGSTIDADYLWRDVIRALIGLSKCHFYGAPTEKLWCIVTVSCYTLNLFAT